MPAERAKSLTVTQRRALIYFYTPFRPSFRLPSNDSRFASPSPTVRNDKQTKRWGT